MIVHNELREFDSFRGLKDYISSITSKMFLASAMQQDWKVTQLSKTKRPRGRMASFSG